LIEDYIFDKITAMKHFLKVWVFYVFSIWLTQQFIPGFVISGRSWQAIFVSGFILSLLMLIVKPILKILFIPINFLTLGLLSWMVNVLVIYIFTLVAPAVSITAWTFSGFTWAGFVIPGFYVSYLWSLILSSITITSIVHILEDVTE